MIMEDFTVRNIRRCEAENGFHHPVQSWTLSDWMTALTGELGEAANIVKKMNRERDGIAGNKKEEVDSYKLMLADELADVYIYLDLFCAAAGINLPEAINRKFLATSMKIGYVDMTGGSQPSGVPGKLMRDLSNDELAGLIATLYEQQAAAPAWGAAVSARDEWLKDLLSEQKRRAL